MSPEGNAVMSQEEIDAMVASGTGGGGETASPAPPAAGPGPPPITAGAPRPMSSSAWRAWKPPSPSWRRRTRKRWRNRCRRSAPGWKNSSSSCRTPWATACAPASCAVRAKHRDSSAPRSRARSAARSRGSAGGLRRPSAFLELRGRFPRPSRPSRRSIHQCFHQAGDRVFFRDHIRGASD